MPMGISNKTRKANKSLLHVDCCRLSEEGVRVPALECMFGGVPQRVRPIVDRIREYGKWLELPWETFSVCFIRVM